MKGKAVPSSVAGESTVATESDITASSVGGVNLDGLSINSSNKVTSYNQSDRLKRYVEGVSERGGTYNRTKAMPGHDEDGRSVSTALASQLGGGYD